MKKLSIMKKTIQILLAIVFIFSININAQTGSNIDFSLGDYTNWKAYQAQNLSSPSTISFSAWTLFNDPTTCFWQGERCFIINSNHNEIDSSVSTGTNILKKIPTGYSSSSQINCAQNNRNANKLSYDLSVTSQNCNITFNYALVFEAPGHGGYQNPFFIIEVRNINSDSSDGSLINSNARFEEIVESPATAGWNTNDAGNSAVIWKNWSQVSMNLQDYIGQTIRINYILASCSPSGHFGYGYVTTQVNPVMDTIFAEICESEVYNQNGFNESTTGFYVDTVYSYFGQNTVNYLNLTVNPSSTTIYHDTICLGSVYNNYGFNFIADSSVILTQNLQTINGCDSIIELNLVVNPIPTAPQNLDIASINVCGIVWKGNAERYKVYRNDSLVGIVTDTFYIDHEVNFFNGELYIYKVKSVIGECESELSDSLIVQFGGLENIKKPSIQTKLYPNPTNNKSYLEIEGLTSEADVLVYDMVGRVIQRHKINKGTKELEIDLSTYAKGVYSIRILNETISQTKKLIITK